MQFLAYLARQSSITHQEHKIDTLVTFYKVFLYFFPRSAGSCFKTNVWLVVKKSVWCFQLIRSIKFLMLTQETQTRAMALKEVFKKGSFVLNNDGRNATCCYGHCWNWLSITVAYLCQIWHFLTNSNPVHRLQPQLIFSVAFWRLDWYLFAERLLKEMQIVVILRTS